MKVEFSGGSLKAMMNNLKKEALELVEKELTKIDSEISKGEKESKISNKNQKD